MPRGTKMFPVSVIPSVTDLGGLPVDIQNPDLDVNIQDQTTPAVEHWLSHHIGDTVIQSDVSKGSNSIDVNTISPLAVTDGAKGYQLEIRYVDLPNNIVRFFQAEIITLTNNTTHFTLEVDTPLDFDLDKTLTEAVCICDANASRASATATPSSRIKMNTTPPDGLSWDLTNIHVTGIMVGAPDDGLFFDQSALTWGIYFGFENSTTALYLANVKTNSEFRAASYDMEYTTRTVPLGTYGISVRKRFGGPQNYGVVMRLSGVTNDEFAVYLQEDFSSVTEVRFKILGHVVEL